MAVILWTMGVFLLIQGCLSSLEQTERGCMRWNQNGSEVCCTACHPGNRLVKVCGPSPKDLCTPCAPGTYTTNSFTYKCTRCTQCVGAQVHLKECTATTDTKCDCKEGLTCGNEHCSFCVEKCGKGSEPTNERSCRPCPDGTFNDQNHQKCKNWSTKCPNPNQIIVVAGDAFTDIQCGNISAIAVPKKPDHTENWPVALSVVPSVLLMVFIIILMIIIIIVAVKTLKKGNKQQKTKKETKKTPIIRTPSDGPRTLIAIECSFHEAQQEQGSSSESLISKDSSGQLIA